MQNIPNRAKNIVQISFNRIEFDLSTSSVIVVGSNLPKVVGSTTTIQEK